MSHSKADCTKFGCLTTLKNEVWRPVPGIPSYEASNLGRIRSVFIHVLQPKLNYRTLKDEPEYELIAIGGKRIMVHRMVAAAFHGPRPQGKIVHHKDHNKRNNVPENLEYVTPSHNTRLAYADGRIGRTHKLTAFARSKVVEMYETGKFRTPQLAEQFRVSRSTILLILRQAGARIHRMRKLTPEIYEEIRRKWIPYHYPVSRLSKEYKVSSAMIEYILGMRASRRGKRLSHAQCGEDIRRDPVASGLYKIREVNHPQELEKGGENA